MILIRLILFYSGCFDLIRLVPGFSINGLRSYQIIFHVDNRHYILQAFYTAIDTDQEVNMLLSVIKPTEPNIKNVLSLSIVNVIDILSNKANSV